MPRQYKHHQNRLNLADNIKTGHSRNWNKGEDSIIGTTRIR